MNSKLSILNKLKINQPTLQPLEDVFIPQINDNLIEKFSDSLLLVGGNLFEVENREEINAFISARFFDAKRVIFEDKINDDLHLCAAQSFHDVDVVVIQTSLGVAENGACWVSTPNNLPRILPFITQHLVLVLKFENIVPTMAEAYTILDQSAYDFGVFISGPSKTADIEQSLVLGAHGARTLDVLILK